MYKSFFVLFVGLFLNDVTSYNPMLTYTVRFKNITIHPNISGEYRIDRYKEKQFLSGRITVDSKILINSVIGVFYRCKPEGIDCEYFQTWKLTDLCHKLLQKNQLWSSFYDAFDPPMFCPIDKVHYTIRNATIEIGPALILYGDAVNYQWRIIQKFYGGNQFIGSYSMDLEMFGYRKKNKLIPKIPIGSSSTKLK